MKKISSSTIFIILIIIVGIISILYNTYNFNKKIEEFQNQNKKSSVEKFTNFSYNDHINVMYNTTLENYKKGLDINDDYKYKKNYQNYIQYYDVKKDFPFITYGCIQSKPNENIYDNLKEKFHTNIHEFYSLSIDDIYQKIVYDLTITLQKTGKDVLDEPVYIIIYQAPNLYFNNEQVVARHDLSNNLKTSYEQNIDDVKIGFEKLFTKLIIIYPNYNNELKLYENEEGLNEFHKYFKDKLSRNKLCFLECNKINTYACGCLNRDESDNSSDFYKSTCIEYTGEKFNYGMVYIINKFNSLFSKQLKRNSIIM